MYNAVHFFIIFHLIKFTNRDEELVVDLFIQVTHTTNIEKTPMYTLAGNILSIEGVQQI